MGTTLRKATLGMRAAVIAVLGMLGTAAPCAALRTEIGVPEIKVIVSPEGAARILLRPASLETLRGQLVTSARLEIPLPARTAPREIPVRVYSLARSWDAATATWTTPWTEPGGDLETGYHDTTRLRAGQATSSLRLDVSSLVRAMAEGEIGEHGFVLAPPPRLGAGFRADELTALGSLAGARIDVHYRDVRSMGMQAGPTGPTGRAARAARGETDAP